MPLLFSEKCGHFIIIISQYIANINSSEKLKISYMIFEYKLYTLSKLNKTNKHEFQNILVLSIESVSV